MEILMEYIAKGFLTMLMISMPCVLTAAGIGLVVGILQAVTQVQEQTIAAAPKILAVFLVIMIGGYGFTSLLTNLTTEGFQMAFNVIPKNSDFVLPSDYYKYTKPFQKEMNDNFDEPSDLKKKLGPSSSFGDKAKNKMQFISPPREEGARTDIIENIQIEENMSN